MAVLNPNSVQFLILHSTNTPAKKLLDACAIDRLHRGTGLLSIGYHFVICRDGSIQVGRKLDQIGAHHKGYNDKSIGICLVGGQDEQGKPSDNFTPKQRDSLNSLLMELSNQFPGASCLDASRNQIILS